MGKGFRYIVNIYPLIVLSIFDLLIKLMKKAVRSEYLKSVLFVFCLGMVCASIFSRKEENIEYLHSSDTNVVDKLEKYNTSAHFFVNKNDSQEYAFWMQYQNMYRRENQKFFVTTYNRITEMDDQCLNQSLFENYDEGVLFYIAVSYNRQDAEHIVDEIIERTDLQEKEYIGTVDSERIFWSYRS